MQLTITTQALAPQLKYPVGRIIICELTDFNQNYIDLVQTGGLPSYQMPDIIHDFFFVFGTVDKSYTFEIAEQEQYGIIVQNLSEIDQSFTHGGHIIQSNPLKVSPGREHVRTDNIPTTQITLVADPYVGDYSSVLTATPVNDWLELTYSGSITAFIGTYALTGPTKASNTLLFESASTGTSIPNPYTTLNKVCSPIPENVELCIDENAAGTGQYVNIIPVNDLLLMPRQELYNVAAIGIFFYKPNKKFTRFQTLHDSRLFDLSSDGTVGQLRPKGSFTFRLQHSKAALGALNKMANERLILVFQNARNEKIIMGTLLFPAQITAYNATLSDKEAFIEITVQNSIKYPLYFSGNL